MKKVLLTVALVALMTSSAFAVITGSAHDFSGAGYGSTELCVFCHTPHNSDTTVANAPLWNHEVTVATYTVYAGLGSLDASVGQPAGVSKLCLSCHDGTVAIDSFGGSTGATNITGVALLGTDLTNDHPVSFTYDASLATTDGGLQDPTVTNSGLGGTIDADMLFGTQLECASCHDVHNTANIPKLLVKLNGGSALCLTCHNK